MFYLEDFDSPGDHRRGFKGLSTAAAWQPWLRSTIPRSLHKNIRLRMLSNLKHILVGLEMKCRLIVPHGERGRHTSVLFEPHFNVLIQEFCLGAFSVVEGLGTAFHMEDVGNDGSTLPYVSPRDWTAALSARWKPARPSTFALDLERIKSTRDKIHQDRQGLWSDIDWHAFSYDGAFAPTRRVLAIGLGANQANLQHLPSATNLR